MPIIQIYPPARWKLHFSYLTGICKGKTASRPAEQFEQITCLFGRFSTLPVETTSDMYQVKTPYTGSSPSGYLYIFTVQFSSVGWRHFKPPCVLIYFFCEWVWGTVMSDMMSGITSSWGHLVRSLMRSSGDVTEGEISGKFRWRDFREISVIFRERDFSEISWVTGSLWRHFKPLCVLIYFF